MHGGIIEIYKASFTKSNQRIHSAFSRHLIYRALASPKTFWALFGA